VVSNTINVTNIMTLEMAMPRCNDDVDMSGAYFG